LFLKPQIDRLAMVLLVPDVKVRGLAVTPPGEAALSGRGRRVALAVAQWNAVVCEGMMKEAVDELRRRGVEVDNGAVEIFRVTGAFELPWLCRQIALSGNFDAIIAIACLFKGETWHFEYVSEAVVQGLMKLNVELDIPVINGVLHCATDDQAVARISHGKDFATAALLQLHSRDLLLMKKPASFSTSA
jgi:6,7-dimethyl-8-ribityllumazine synthase